MARKTLRPARTLVLFFVGLAIIFGLVALAGQWKPSLGLDLQGGTRITLTAVGKVDPESLQEAADIIDQRVNGSGVAEAEVTTQANKYIVVEVPGPSDSGLVDIVRRQAQLRFRLVALGPVDGSSPSAPQQPGSNPTRIPGEGVTAPATKTPSAAPSGAPSGGASQGASSTPKGRPAPGFADPSGSPSGSPSGNPSDGPSGSPSGDPSGTPGRSPSTDPQQARMASINNPLAWQENPDQQSVAAFNKFTCPAQGSAPVVKDNPKMPLITCDNKGQKFLLSKAVIEGTQVKDASAGIPPEDVNWAVQLSLKSEGTKTLAEISQKLVGTKKTFAITLDGVVLTAPTFNGVITDGRPQITGSFNQESAQDLATSLRFGSLPIAFDRDVTDEEIGPSLAGNQLSAGITAGVVGLLLVMLYCLFYYRGLGIVVIASLVVAGATTYGLVLLLSKTAGFTLTLPGIAGLIVAVGITADSFIVFFERIRDEMRDGKSMRVAVEAGWARARNTAVAADMVSLLAAVVLYIFATGVVKGFAFALGLSTIIDLVVFFWFTKPMVSWLGTYKFFNQGHKLSGLDAENLGVDRLPGLSPRVRTGGKA